MLFFLLIKTKMTDRIVFSLRVVEPGQMVSWCRRRPTCALMEAVPHSCWVGPPLHRPRTTSVIPTRPAAAPRCRRSRSPGVPQPPAMLAAALRSPASTSSTCTGEWRTAARRRTGACRWSSDCHLRPRRLRPPPCHRPSARSAACCTPPPSSIPAP